MLTLNYKEPPMNQPKVSVGIIVTKNNNILMLRRYNTGYEDGLETFRQAMVREANQYSLYTICS